AASSALADALATAAFVMGMGKGGRLLEQYPGTEAIFVDRNLTAFPTRGLAGRFTAAQGTLCAAPD
ncbi:MAG TPA: FAD:protein FMN transferase, partial [Candidatus Limnocylindria bacterium]|nr:FAD:protein FMN transferase [Candidatus Limnocylindria bacterium]